MEFSSKISPSGSQPPSVKGSRRLSTGSQPTQVFHLSKISTSLDESSPSFAHATALDWMDKKFQLINKHPNTRQITTSVSSVRKRKSRQTDPFLDKLKLEHRCNPDGKQVINLPKTPYGKHRTYNEANNFLRRHIVDTSTNIDKELAKEMNDIARKFKLVDKRTKVKHKARLSNRVTLRELEDHYVMPTKTGLLICPIQQSLVDRYEKDKQKYNDTTSNMMAQTHREVPLGNPILKNYKTTDSPKASINKIMNRLYQTPTDDKATSLSIAISQKYEPLFDSSSRKVSSWEVILKEQEGKMSLSREA